MGKPMGKKKINILVMNQTGLRTRNVGCLLVLFFLIAAPARADYKADVDYTRLTSELGVSMPDGAGIPVSQVEAVMQVGTNQAWMPDPNHAQFAGKTITDISGAVPGVFSGHANAVGQRFYGGITSTSPGITAVSSYLAGDWISVGFLQVSPPGSVPLQPLFSASRISNHSWIGSMGAFDLDTLARLDWVVETDEMIQVAGFTGSSRRPLLSSAYNVISVNKTGALTTAGSASAGGIYTAGRTKPDIVAPATNASTATPRVASASALLIEVAHNNPGLSTDQKANSTTNRNGDTVYNAERVEVIKAALMAGADRTTGNTTSTDISDYRINTIDRTTNGLDRRFGAGQLNVYNSYHIIAAGEQNSIEDLPSGGGLIGQTGFDYDPEFGGSKGSNSTATYYLPAAVGPTRLTASLAWNMAVDGGKATSFNSSATLYDLNLLLFDVTDPDNWVLAGSSDSTNENTENMWQLLNSSKDYALQVETGAGQNQFNWDYALAWRITPVVPLAVDPIVLPDALLNAVYPPQTLTAVNGQPPYTWTIVGGVLPPGLNLSPSGAISGTPLVVFTNTNFTVQVTDAVLGTSTLALSLTVKNRDGCAFSCHGNPGF